MLEGKHYLFFFAFFFAAINLTSFRNSIVPPGSSRNQDLLPSLYRLQFFLDRLECIRCHFPEPLIAFQ
jgi:hypothetical protein